MDASPTVLEKRLASLSSPEELSKFLMDKREGFHKSCTGMQNKEKLECKRKSYKKQRTETEDPSRKMTRLSTSLKTFQKIVSFVKSWIPKKRYMNICQYLLAIA